MQVRVAWMCRFGFVALGVLHAPGGGAAERKHFDLVPMYGGMDRSAIPALKAGDAELIEGTTRRFGSRRAASMAFVDTAFRYYQQDKLDVAMRRFNQAWLIDPDNPEVYWGFATVLHDQGEYCEGVRLIELGESKGPMQKGYLPDLGYLHAACGQYGDGLTDAQKRAHFARSDDAFTAAEQRDEVQKHHLYYQWTRAAIERGDYATAWKHVKSYRAHTREPFDRDVLAELAARMPEPD